MPFTSTLFVAFICCFLPIFWALEFRSRRAAIHFTAIASLGFVAINFPLFSLIPISHALAVLAFQRSSRSLPKMWVTIAFILSPLLIFKYYDFFAKTVGVEPYGLTLPLGISFYAFTAVGFVVDQYKNRYDIPNPRFVDNLRLLTFWPHLASGPILRGNDFFFKSCGKRLAERDISTALVLIVFGLYKKIVIADGVGGLLNQNLEKGISSMDRFDSWSTIAGFSVQIYGDFSGYSDMAIGFAILLGIFIPANFDYPYSATSVTEFWRRWHISLSSWFRDYVYIPLGGNANGLLAGSMVVMVVFTLSGLWHGAAWNFIIWGAMHGAILILERLGRRIGLRPPKVLAWFLTITVVSLAWCFFFLNYGDALEMISNAFTKTDHDAEFNTLAIWFYALLIAFDFLIRPYRVQKGHIKATTAGIALSPLILTICFYFAGKPLPFIYFDF